MVNPVLVGNWRDTPENMRRALASCASRLSGVSISCDPAHPADAVVVQQLAREFNLPANVYFTARPPADPHAFCESGGGGALRTTIMREGERFARELGAEHVVNLDSDDWLEFDEGFTWPHGALVEDGGRAAPCYWILEECSGETYPFKRLFRVGCDWSWYGPIHEEPLCETVAIDAMCPMLPRVKYVKPHDGPRDPKHYLHHADICRAWLETHPEAHKYQYYLGRSLTDAGLAAEAVTEYARYLSGPGDASFRYVAARNACGHMARSEAVTPMEMISALRIWVEVDPYRAEPWRALGSMATKIADSLPMNKGAVHLQREAYGKR